MIYEKIKDLLNSLNIQFPTPEVERQFIESVTFENIKSISDRYATTIELSNDKKVEASTLSFYNIFKFSQRKFVDYIETMMRSAVPLFLPDQSLGITLSLLFFCWSTFKDTKKKYCEQDAKVLLSLYLIGGSGDIEDISDKYYHYFEKYLPSDDIFMSLQLLGEYRVVKQDANGKIVIVDTIELIKV